MIRNRSHRLGYLALLLVVTVAGCGKSPNARFYLLSAHPADEDSEIATRLPEGQVIGLQSITIAKHLDRPQIVVRLSPNRIGLSQFDLWAEPLKDNVTEVVASNLRALLGTDRVIVAPRLGGLNVQYRVNIMLLRLDGFPGGEATLEARWAVTTGEDDGTRPGIRHARYTQKVATNTHEALVRAESALLMSLSRDVAAAIRAQAMPDS